jgi:hypothetical protein
MDDLSPLQRLCRPPVSERESSFALPRQIDQHNVGVLPKAVKHHSFAIRSNVESPCGETVEVGKLVSFLGSEIKELKGRFGGYGPNDIDELSAPRKEPIPFPTHPHLNRWRLHRIPIRLDYLERAE